MLAARISVHHSPPKEQAGRVFPRGLQHAAGLDSRVRTTAVASAYVSCRSASTRCLGGRSAALAPRSDARRVLAGDKRLAIHTLPARAHAARHTPLRWTILWLGLRASRNRVGELRNAFDRRRLFEITGAGRHTRGLLPCRLSLRKRAARRANQSNSARSSAERSGRDSERLSLLLRRLRPERRPLHADLHVPHRPISQADRLSVTVA